MAKPANIVVQIPFTLQGIPCLIGVTEYFNQPAYTGSAHNCDSDWDYYGYSDIEFTMLDRKGYAAPWLERKLTNNDRSLCEAKIMEFFAQND